jgi:hypothetical protein
VHLDSARLTPDLEEITPPEVHLYPAQSRTDPKIMPSAAKQRFRELVQSVPEPEPDHAVDGQAHTAIKIAIEQLAEQLAAFCFEHLERSVDPTIDGTTRVDVEIDMDRLAEELQVSDLQWY